MSKKQILQQLSFGHRIAEEEVNDLASYFVETDQWTRIYNGEVDVIYGQKGAGKSAIYSLLLNREQEFADKGIVLIAAENPRGTPAFKDIVSNPPTSEHEFTSLWKLYFLSLIGYHIRHFNNSNSKIVVSALEKAGLLPRELNLRSIIQNVFDYARSIIKAESIEGGLQIDPTTGLPNGVTGKITLREPNAALRDFGYRSLDALLSLCNDALKSEEKSIWMLIDRLDVAFAESMELEQNALRALFKVYLDILDLDYISPKIFLRSDIWRRITKSGFREASHITRYITLTWNYQSLMNLVVRRLLRNEAILISTGVSPNMILQDTSKQKDFFYKIYPVQVDSGSNKPETFDWILSRTRDSYDDTAPRELIHLLSASREVQLRKLEIGNKEPNGDVLFDGSTFKEALQEVSKVRLEQTLYAEYSMYRPYLEKLTRGKTEQNIESLSHLWSTASEESIDIANALVEIGFFRKVEKRNSTTYWVPFLYRSALRMVQGSV